ncbi:CDGSH iron-sulfur domain-containing protein [Leptospira ilyithenensis]|uniref:CDGSH iron-sulfur domain-containing protein n=2 Tax=Leptospira ilyithenensis TaxID=2484901 RepID=A0A4R9LU30_9LEPT|nr:CDGSH iron-sulfur domain-containing protein [Leptospira ilyithenensis]
MSYPKIAQKSPYMISMKEGEKKAWCSCGASSTQPFCDGSHSRENTGMKPVIFKCQIAEEIFLCGCKQTKSPPYCDGTHKSL